MIFFICIVNALLNNNNPQLIYKEVEIFIKHPHPNPIIFHASFHNTMGS